MAVIVQERKAEELLTTFLLGLLPWTQARIIKETVPWVASYISF